MPRWIATSVEGHAICRMEAPEIFRVVERPDGYDRVEVILDPVPETLREKFEAAVCSCLNRTLSIEE